MGRMLLLMALSNTTQKCRIYWNGRQVNILEKETKKINKDKLPFAVFIAPKNSDDTEDYKQIFTDIISDRIKEKFRYYYEKH